MMAIVPCSRASSHAAVRVAVNGGETEDHTYGLDPEAPDGNNKRQSRRRAMTLPSADERDAHVPWVTGQPNARTSMVCAYTPRGASLRKQ